MVSRCGFGVGDYEGVSDLRPLAGLTCLQRLFRPPHGGVSDLTPLAELNNPLNALPQRAPKVSLTLVSRWPGLLNSRWVDLRDIRTCPDLAPLARASKCGLTIHH